MGYTHYVRQLDLSDEMFENFKKDFNLIVEEAAMRLRTLRIEENSVYLDGDPGHETFCVHKNKSDAYYTGGSPGDDDMVFSCCKTRRKPYDKIVTASLLALKYHAGDLVVISSDGYLEDWQDGIELYKEATGRSTVPILPNVGLNG